MELGIGLTFNIFLKKEVKVQSFDGDSIELLTYKKVYVLCTAPISQHVLLLSIVGEISCK